MSQTESLRQNWKFIRQDNPAFAQPDVDDSAWQTVNVPHDWAIRGPFDKENDCYSTQIMQDGETKPMLHFGRTGGLPHVGVAWYRRELTLPKLTDDDCCFLEFQGVMSHSTVFVNGKQVAQRPFGYISFSTEITQALNPQGKNILAVRVDNPDQASRWYPGAGIIRPVTLAVKPLTHIRYNGLWCYDTDLDLKRRTAVLNLKLELSRQDPQCVAKLLIEPQDKAWFRMVTFQGDSTQVPLEDLELWSPENPFLYDLTVQLIKDGKVIDQQQLKYGFRRVAFDAQHGMTLNGKPYYLKGVCLHHDHGPLGAAFSVPAATRQLTLLRKIGCNAVRTSHNPPAPQFLDLCDAMGFLVMDEAFDVWEIPKIQHDYSELFKQWHERDLKDFIKRDRNHPSVILWSIGNEVNEQNTPDGNKLAQRLVKICHNTDPFRKVSEGLSSLKCLDNDMPAALDVIGWNYKPAHYGKLHDAYPQSPMFGSETASTVSSRGVYYFPIQTKQPWDKTEYHHQCSSFDMEFPPWATTPEQEFAAQDQFPWMFGEFVWTGFDYLGEPTPFNSWPSHSSYFGIYDLAGLPKDRAWLYAARWSDKPVLHLLPHWNWPEAKGQNLPVVVYTNYHQVELFVNGISQGIKARPDQSTYRITWEQVTYEPGNITAIARDNQGQELERTIINTAGKPAHLKLQTDRNRLRKNMQDLAYVTVTVEDQDGNTVPTANLPLTFTVTGQGEFAAAANGDATCLEPFQDGTMSTFNGACVAILRAGDQEGDITLTVTTPNLPDAQLTVTVN